MKIFHTADVHLTPNHPERLEALEEIVDICRREEADLLLITGDLFDGNADIEDLKTDLRGLFSENSFDTLVIPGNHDRSAFRKEDFFGDDLEVLTEHPFERKEYDEVNIVGVPYTDKEFSDLAEDLSEASVEGKKNILMLHCTLTGVSGSFGEETEYLPVRPEGIVQTGFDYVLAGHIHSSATRRSFEDTVFAYSGSPSSVSTSETGRREIWRLEEELSTVGLDSFHYLKQDIDVLPGEEESLLEKTASSFNGRDISQACVLIEVTGFTERSVKQLQKQFSDCVEDAREVRVDIERLESASSIVESDLYNEFQQRLKDKDFENPGQIEKKFLRGLSRYER